MNNPFKHCVYVEALFGRAPFASRSYAELEEKIRSNQPIEVSSEQQTSSSLVNCQTETVGSPAEKYV